MFKKIKLQDLPSYFYFGIKWNAFEVIAFQIILITHQTILFYSCKNITYGLIATVLSFLYLNISILNFGLDKSLTTFYKSIISSKKNFKKIFLSQVIIQIFIMATFPATIFFILRKFEIGCQYLTSIDLLLIFLIFITESIRKTFRAFAQLAFLNNQTAILEIISVIVYVTIFWNLYFYTGSAGLTIALLPLLIESLISVFVLSLIIRNIYKNITLNEEYFLTVKEIIFNRVSIFITQLSSLIFSSNLILTTISFRYGLQAAAILQLSKNIINFLFLLLEKTFGITSGSLFTRIKDNNLQIKQKNYNLSVNSVYTSICLILIFTSSVFLFLYFLKPNLYISQIVESFLFTLAILSNTMFIPQEQILLVEKKIYFLMIGNLISALLYYLSIVFLPLKFILGTFIFLRLFLLKIIINLIQKNLKIKTTFRKPIVFIAILFIMLPIILTLFIHIK
jgi:hypothetical protein